MKTAVGDNFKKKVLFFHKQYKVKLNFFGRLTNAIRNTLLCVMTEGNSYFKILVPIFGSLDCQLQNFTLAKGLSLFISCTPYIQPLFVVRPSVCLASVLIEKPP